MQDALPLKARRRLRVRYLLAALVVVVATAGLTTGLYLWLRGGDETSPRVVTGIQFPYPDGWREQTLTEADRQAGLILSLNHRQPDASFLARTVVATLPEDFDIGALENETVEALSVDVDGFELVRSNISRIGAFDALTIEYLQPDQEGASGHRVLMAVIPTPHQTYYLTFRAERADFRDVEEEGLGIMDTFAAYIEAAGQ